MGDILDTLKSDHRDLLALLSEICSTEDREKDRRKDLLRRIEAHLVPHAKWEEIVFYPAFAERASHEELLLYAEALQEHRAVEMAVLPDIKAIDIDSRQFAGSVNVLRELLSHHIEEEENDFFQAFERHFSPDERADLDRQYAEWKDSAASSAILGYAKVKSNIASVMRFPGGAQG
ncbi:hemerythrin domain-containing protein [Coralloluteibacterium thermophilus]|uniref:Hemerythrin domain-containing protein n=1 Tax=Coralloluteibacterium thermophilum TaxID=2707049 RepID=A0ABV9NMJ6_9GAMM